MSCLIPLGNRVIVRPKKAEEVTSFGLVLAESNKEKPMEGVVISVSDTVKDSPIKAGDTVLFKKYSPTEFTIENEDIFVLDIEDLLAKIG